MNFKTIEMAGTLVPTNAEYRGVQRAALIARTRSPSLFAEEYVRNLERYAGFDDALESAARSRRTNRHRRST